MRRQFLVLLLARLGGAAVQAAVGIGLARSVDPALYGEITGLAGATLFWLILCGLGLGSYLGRARARGDDDEVATALRLNAGTSAGGAVLAALAVLSGVVPLQAGPVLLLVIAGTAVDKYVDTLLAVPIADGERRLPSLSVLARRLVTAAVFFGLLLAGADGVPAYGIGMLAGAAAGLLHLSLALPRRIAPGRASARRVIGASIPFAINDVAIQSRSLDVAAVALVASPAAAGLYSAAAKLTSPFELISSTLASVLLPHAARADPARVRRTALLLAAAAAALTPLAALFALVDEPLVVLVLGADYAAAAPALTWLLVAVPIIALGSPFSALLQGIGRERLVAAVSVLGALATLAAIVAGALLAGAVGAAVGVLAAASVKAAALLVGIVSTPLEPRRA